MAVPWREYRYLLSRRAGWRCGFPSGWMCLVDLDFPSALFPSTEALILTRVSGHSPLGMQVTWHFER